MSPIQQHTIHLRIICLTAWLLMSGGTYAQSSFGGSVFDFNHIVSYIIAILLIATMVLLFYNRICVFKEQQAIGEFRSQNTRLVSVLQAGRMMLWVYDTDNRHYRLLSETGELTKEYNPIDFAQFYDRDDFENLCTAIFDICESHRVTSTLTMRSRPADGTCRYYEMYLSIAARDKNGHITQLLGVQHDITDMHEKQQNSKELLMRYHTVFNNSLVDMLYYDKDRVLADINDTACKTFHIPDRQQFLDSKFLLKDNPLFLGLDEQQLKNVWTTTLINFSNYQDDRYRLRSFALQGKMYYESVINTVHNKSGELEGMYIAGRNATEMVESFHQQREGAIRLKKATQHILDYIDNINYALQVNHVLLVNYFPDKSTLYLSSSVDKTQIALSQLRCIRLAMPRYRRAVSSALNRMDHRSKLPIDLTIETDIHDQKGRQIAMMFNIVPILDDQGQVKHYFGMCRNMTDLLETERRLAIETEKAKEAELLKESFLTNMSYEIRTPLSAVIGFAECFDSEHDESDEPLFVEEIKKNTNILLRLINDILFLSKLDADMVEFKHEDFDFVEFFNTSCQMGWSDANPDVTTHINNPYERLVLNGDPEQVGRVLQMVCHLSAKHTHKGTILAKYEFRRDELIAIIEDTGEGIDEDTLSKIFGRFARDKEDRLFGTGLDIPIIQSLLTKMGGSIDIQSEAGKGTTVWIILKMKPVEIVKKREFVAIS